MRTITNTNQDTKGLSDMALNKFYEDLFNGKFDILQFGWSYKQDDYYYYFYPVKIPAKDFSFEIHEYHSLTKKLIKGSNELS